MRGELVAVVGAQYGSEGKGVVVNHLASKFRVHVRVGGPNAGHSFYHRDQLYKMQVIPVGWTNPDADLFIGRGALVDPHRLETELKLVETVDPTIRGRLFVDAGAGVLDESHHKQGGGVQGETHRRYGSTGEGVGPARVGRILRDPTKFRLMRDLPVGQGFTIVEDTPHMIHDRLHTGDNVLLEGTQGQGLSLVHGPWPYATNHDTGAAQLLADVGLAPSELDNVLLVTRTYPIRVAGNSGPMLNELTWDEMSRRIGRPVLEHTTVTKKVRRIGEWDERLFLDAVRINGAAAVAVMFMDYLCPADEGKTKANQLSDRAWSFIEYIERVGDVSVQYVGTGGPRFSVIDLDRR
jgi:adenylosuccinate synthase